MSLKVGIVGLPNVGKSTLFNAITKSQVEAANYPFATIDPNVGVVPVPDERLPKLAIQEKSAKIVPASIEFVDIAGLVAGAHKGEGLGNQFLSHIREVDAILEVTRIFDNSDIIHVDGSIDPKRDMETIAIELQLADLQTVDKRLTSLTKQVKSGDKLAIKLEALLQKYRAALENGKMANLVELSEEEKKTAREIQLLTTKPFLYAYNAEYDVNNKSYIIPGGSIDSQSSMIVDAKLEGELAELEDNERQEYLQELGLEQSGLDQIITTAYQTLNLITFITSGPQETKAWTCPAGSTAPQAAGKIHTDFEKGFIKAEVIAWDKLLEAGSYPAAKDKGWLRIEGKEYIVQDGDVVHFRFSK
ncbi:MAG: redox-regulated ATPase YchF [Candidatus Doudnabacteria bacterium]